jgi:hypothetical protein
MKWTVKIALLLMVLGFCVAKPASSYAYWHHHHDYVSVHFGVWPGYYGYGYPYDPYYYPYAEPYYYAAPAVVSTTSYQPVVVNGVTYYLNNGVYYTYTQYGYQAVATPAGVAAPQAAPVGAETTTVSAEADNSITINIPNGKGGYTAVVLKKSGTGFVGPQGEFYAEFPKVSQLQTMYGK